MTTRYTLVLGSEIPNYGERINSLGYPDPDYMYNNIAIIEKGNSAHTINLNNNILREALLSNRDFCLKYLGLKIYDRSETPEKVVEKVVKKTVIVDGNLPEPKPKTQTRKRKIDPELLDTLG